MTVNLATSSTTFPTTQALVNTAFVTSKGASTYQLGDGSGWIVAFGAPILPCQVITVSITVLAVTEGSYYLDLAPRIAGSPNSIPPGDVLSDTAILEAGQSATLTATITMPPGSQFLWSHLMRSPTPSTEDKITLTTPFTLDVHVTAELLAAAIDTDTGRTAEISGAGNLVVTQAPAGAPGGSLTWLCDSWLAAQAVAAIHRAGTVTVEGGTLDGLVYWATGKVRATADRTVPGIPARWLVQVDIQEAS